MAIYKKPCMHCGAYIEADSRFCPVCQSGSPFENLCPACLRPVQKGTAICSGCGRPLCTACPACNKQTFVQEKCEHCGASLMKRCQNPRCGVLQFFENSKCTACGKKMNKQ